MTKGKFGIHGGQFVPETLMNAINEFEEAYNRYKDDPEFVAELDTLMREYAGRPSLLYYAEKMTKDLGGALPISAGWLSAPEAGIRKNRTGRLAILGRLPCFFCCLAGDFAQIGRAHV